MRHTDVLIDIYLYRCRGGYPIEAWRYFMLHGVCTGGHYAEKKLTDEYQYKLSQEKLLRMFANHMPFILVVIIVMRYIMENAPKKYSQHHNVHNHAKPDMLVIMKTIKFTARKSAYALPNNEKAIQREIMTNGPVQAAFMVYEDFSRYRSGIYVHTAGRREGGHAVKLIGWGVDDDGNKYWLAANSWNSDWGENGYFRIVRGVDHCGIESAVVAGMPDV
ncbi:papain family cysteine protease [Dictyocaulus viviparus]|uniref:Papain family cysteine protease n=1 Tax=Dictyocaulus viviparus TaxID=29172 RepID=A0A0D8XIZ1_DICVI|nr:papain family cysteine protease [Dictyocaulus viviparus]